MKIAIFSDCHCGYGYGTERGEDAFRGLEEAIEKSLDCDLILMGGDIFDTRIPKPEVFSRAARIMSKAQHIPSKTTFFEVKNKDRNQISPLALRGIPIVAIHGTHERRSKHLINPIQALEHAGLLVHLDCSTAIFEIDGKKVAIHGMSGVPDRYAGQVLKDWNPQPIPDATNILMFHQSIEPYIYSPLEPPTIKLEDLPKGFDLYILGHIHWNDIKDLHTGKFLLTGSTTFTSMHKTEALQPKYIYHFNGDLQKVELNSQRKVFWNEMEYSPGVKDQIDHILRDVPQLDPKPISIFKIDSTSFVTLVDCGDSTKCPFFLNSAVVLPLSINLVTVYSSSPISNEIETSALSFFTGFFITISSNFIFLDCKVGKVPNKPKHDASKIEVFPAPIVPIKQLVPSEKSIEVSK